MASWLPIPTLHAAFLPTPRHLVLPFTSAVPLSYEPYYISGIVPLLNRVRGEGRDCVAFANCDCGSPSKTRTHTQKLNQISGPISRQDDITREFLDLCIRRVWV